MDSALPDDVGNGGVVGDAIDPGTEGTAGVPCGKAAPEGEVNLLEEVAQMVGVGLVGASEAFEGSAEKGGGLAILIILRSFHG